MKGKFNSHSREVRKVEDRPLLPQLHSLTTTVPGVQLAAVERDDSEIHLRALFSRSRVALSVLGAGDAICS